MTSEIIEVQIARMQEQVKQLLEASNRAESARKGQYEQLEKIGHDVTSLSHRMEQVEKQLSATAPTIAEFLELKHKVTGAGVAGRWLWGVGGALIGAIAVSREFLITWLSKGN